MDWEDLRAYAKSQETLTPPGRTEESMTLYGDYKEWCSTQGLTNADYVKQYVEWCDESEIAFEPCLAPYHLSPKVQHWILWHHPDSIPGGSILVPSKEIETVRSLLQSPGQSMLLQNDEVICFQNLPSIRSIPTIAHSHVFIRSATTALLGLLSRRRAAWLARSPFLRIQKL